MVCLAYGDDGNDGYEVEVGDAITIYKIIYIYIYVLTVSIVW